MTKLLAALNLPQVGDIKLADDSVSLRSCKRAAQAEDETEKGCVFSIHLNDRDYLLKTTTPSDAERWVEVLNQLKNNTVTSEWCKSN